MGRGPGCTHWSKSSRLGLVLHVSIRFQVIAGSKLAGGGRAARITLTHTHTHSMQRDARHPSHCHCGTARRVTRRTTCDPMRGDARTFSAPRAMLPHHLLRRCACSRVHPSSDRAGTGHCLMHMLRIRPGRVVRARASHQKRRSAFFLSCAFAFFWMAFAMGCSEGHNFPRRRATSWRARCRRSSTCEGPPAVRGAGGRPAL